MIRITLVILTFMSLVPSPTGAQDRKPNIVFILMDNLGYREPGCYGGGDRARGAAATETRQPQGVRPDQRSQGRILQTALRNTWQAEPAMKILADFEASLKKYPTIAPGTPDPYIPPNERHSTS
jgi:hypothetical protein